MRFLCVTIPLLLCLLACAPPTVDRYHTAENEAEIVALLNERQYTKAIWLIEQRGRNPSGELAYLLGQAYLGRAGIEPMEFAAKVAEPEPETEAARIIFPKCPRGRLEGKLDAKCVLKRVYLHSPRADNQDFAKARALFRQAYPDPANTPIWVNTLIGMTETISLVRRAGDLFLVGKRVKVKDGNITPPAVDVSWLKIQGEESMREAKEALGRANHSGEKISRFLSGSKANEWFERIEGTVDFAKGVGLSRFLDFVRENLLKPADEIRYGESLDRLKAMLENLERD